MASKGNILIAEDDAVLRDVYVKKFTIAGFDIRTVQNGQLAVEEITKNPPDILLLDINMPVMDGFAVLQQFPREKRNFPVILLTNFGDDKNRQQGESLGADELYIKREMTIRKLLEMVESLLKAKKMWNK